MTGTESSTDFATLLKDATEASKVPAKRRTVSVKSTIESLTSLAYDRGIFPDDLNELVDLITTPSHLDQASLGALAKNLYPIGKVPDGVVLKVIGCLGHGELKPSLAIQGLLLRWLILVYHILAKPAVLSQAYAILFNLLDTAATRPQVGHLLALITRRKHVRPFRIQAILSLSRQTGHDASLIGLLRVYKNYYPEVIVGDATKGKGSSFKHPDPDWRARLEEIHGAHRQQELDGNGHLRDGFRVNHQLNRRAAGRGAVTVPLVHTSHAQENSVTLEEIESAESLALSLEKIELPNQLVAVLADPLLQKLLLLRPSSDSFARVDNWLRACLPDVASGDTGSDELAGFLAVIVDYVRCLKVLPPVLLELLQEIFKHWDGVHQRALILEALTYTPLSNFEERYTATFQPLEARMLDNTPESQLDLLTFYMSLMRRWTVLLLSANDRQAGASDAVSGLAQHVNKLCLTLIQTSPTTSTHLAILDCYEQVAATISMPGLLRHTHGTIPPPAAVYTLHFSHSVAVLSRLCGVLATYKKTLELLMSRSSNKDLSAGERDRVNVFNGFLMDICNCVWRGRALTKTDTNALGCCIPQSMVPTLSKYVSNIDSDLSLPSLFGLSHSPAMCLESAAFMSGLEEAELIEGGEGALEKRHAGPASQASLTQLGKDGGLSLGWQEYRSGVLKHLEGNGLPGVPELMYSTMKNLRSARRP